jgi:hypothetical protein
VIAALTAARDSSETLNHFLINASHVMDARVKSMIEATAALLKTNLSDPQRTSVETILQSAESFDRYINDMVDFSDIETGNLELEVEEFAPANVIEEAGNLFRSVAERKGLKFHCMDGEGLPPSVRGDRGRLRQVLNHLIHNAIRFTEQGEISVRARLMNETAGRSKLRFEVRDTGIGLTERVRGRLFQPFCRPEDSSVPDAGTGGLGLAISKRLAELMGGGIEVFSKAGNGTTFWLTAVFETARKEDTNSDDRVTPTTATAAVSPTFPHLSVDRVKERRTRARRRVSRPALLKSRAAGIAMVRLINASTSGLRISVPFLLPLGDEVEIRIDDAVILAVVRNCLCIRAHEFHVGVEIPESTSHDTLRVDLPRLLSR